MRFMRALAAMLERGALDGRVARALEQVWGRVAAARLVKPLRWRDGARIIAVGGATLGGSGKTPLAIACARELARGGARVAIVGHAHRAAPGWARVVGSDDAVDEVGEEALVCARATAAEGVVVVVAPTRQSALERALRGADVAILDGVHQTTPRRASLALLALDPYAPWGARSCPPRGDLRAPIGSLLDVADRAVEVRSTSRGAWVHPAGPGAGALLDWARLRGMRIGLLTAIARPARVHRLLIANGVIPVVVRTFSDHSRVCIRPACGVDLWLLTAKCAASLLPRRNVGGLADVAVIDHEVSLQGDVVAALRREALDPAPYAVLR
jgi:tetraacyldisaccharide 4'-kinase